MRAVVPGIVGAKIDNAVAPAGGELLIDAKRRGSWVEQLFLTGPTNIVCKGQITDEDLAF